jgi:nucleoside-diphosphate-sugar epimerase
MKILITGATGFLGKILYKSIDHQIEKYCLSRSNSHYNYDLENNIPIFTNYFDTVIHSAGKAHLIPKTQEEINSFYESNVNGTINLLKGLEFILPKKLVFISSVSVYGLTNGENIDESKPLLSIDPYGISKIKAEEVVKKWCEEHNVICTILRLPLIVGNNPPGNLGAMIRGINKGYYFNIGGGNAQKSMVLATDIAKFILKAAEKGGTFNLTDGYHPSFNELSKTIASQMGKSFVPNMPKFIAISLANIGNLLVNKFPLNSIKYKKITSSLTFDDTKARKAFGWNPSPVLDFFKTQQDAK